MITPHGPIEAGELADDAVTTAKIVDDAVTAVKAAIFLSGKVTSDAGTQTNPHGLGASPSVFFAILQETAASANPELAATADATNVYVSAASTDVKYIVFAWL